MLPLDKSENRAPASAATARRRPGKPIKTVRKKSKRKKSRWGDMFEDAFDMIEDIFD